MLSKYRLTILLLLTSAFHCYAQLDSRAGTNYELSHLHKANGKFPRKIIAETVWPIKQKNSLKDTIRERLLSTTVLDGDGNTIMYKSFLNGFSWSESTYEGKPFPHGLSYSNFEFFNGKKIKESEVKSMRLSKNVYVTLRESFSTWFGQPDTNLTLLNHYYYLTDPSSKITTEIETSYQPGSPAQSEVRRDFDMNGNILRTYNSHDSTSSTYYYPLPFLNAPYSRPDSIMNISQMNGFVSYYLIHCVRNEFGDAVKILHYNWREGELRRLGLEINFKFKYDKHGNWIYMEKQSLDSATNPLNKFQIVKRKIFY